MKYNFVDGDDEEIAGLLRDFGADVPKMIFKRKCLLNNILGKDKKPFVIRM